MAFESDYAQYIPIKCYIRDNFLITKITFKSIIVKLLTHFSKMQMKYALSDLFTYCSKLEQTLVPPSLARQI